MGLPRYYNDHGIAPFWNSFVKRIIKNDGVTVLDDHHFGGSLKHLYVKDGRLLMLGAYGLDEVKLGTERSLANYLFYGTAPLPKESGPSSMTIYKPLATAKGHEKRVMQTTWSTRNGVPRLTFDDTRVSKSGKIVKNYWDVVKGCETQRASILKLWEKAHGIKTDTDKLRRLSGLSSPQNGDDAAAGNDNRQGGQLLKQIS